MALPACQPRLLSGRISNGTMRLSRPRIAPNIFRTRDDGADVLHRPNGLRDITDLHGAAGRAILRSRGGEIRATGTRGLGAFLRPTSLVRCCQVLVGAFEPGRAAQAKACSPHARVSVSADQAHGPSFYIT